jgi:hypothetical protein
VRLNGWMRIGVVLSILWVGGYGAYLWNLESQRLEAIRSDRTDAAALCDLQTRMATVFKQKPEPCQTQAELDREQEARAVFDYAGVIEPTLIWLIAGWAAILAVYGVVRWIMRGFRPAT